MKNKMNLVHALHKIELNIALFSVFCSLWTSLNLIVFRVLCKLW